MTSLVREKMTLNDKVVTDQSAPVIIRSNRIALRLGEFAKKENLVVRTQTMHSALLLASKLMYSYYHNGPFTGRAESFDWQAQWDSIQSAYDVNYNPDRWAAVYLDGKPVFHTKPELYMDVVEKCALLNPESYDAAVAQIEKTLEQVGQHKSVEHVSNVAVTFMDRDGIMQCGNVHRSFGKNTTFSFTAAGSTENHRVTQAMSVAAALIEGLNLQHVVQTMQEKVRAQEITPNSVAANKMRSATARMIKLSQHIDAFEGSYDVKYRPAKPEFFKKDL